MRGLGILILVVVFFWVVWPWISKWLKKKAAEKAEDYVRRSMGMPPRDHKKKTTGYESQEQYYRRQRRNPFGPDRYTDEPIIPKEYAEDVEFTETKEFSADTSRFRSENKVETYHESQISDAEWTDVKKPGSK